MFFYEKIQKASELLDSAICDLRAYGEADSTMLITLLKMSENSADEALSHVNQTIKESISKQFEGSDLKLPFDFDENGNVV